MRINFIEVSGFRGFRDKVRSNFGRGFTVISGRNGAGKSTLCDAVEFAITGSIDKYAVEKAAKESLSDYLWWRGEGRPEAYYVTVDFVAEDGNSFTITRTRESGPDKRDEDIQAVLCKNSAPDEALKQLMRTTIIRDEWIAPLSLDLKETERFEFVRAALGAPEGTDLADKAKEVIEAAEEALSSDEKAYETARTRLSDCIAEQSEARAALGHSEDISVALKIVENFVANSSSDIASRLSAGRQALIDGRVNLDRMGEALQMGREVAQAQVKFHAPEAVAMREAASAALDTAAQTKVAADNDVSVAERQFVLEEEANATAASLALLVEQGEHLGLDGNRCPLCAAPQTSEQFLKGLEIARQRIATLSAGVQRARSMLIAARDNQTKALENLQDCETRVAAFAKEESQLQAQERAHRKFYEQSGLDFQFMQDPERLELEMARQRDRLINLERALLVLESSQFVSRFSSIESNIAELRSEIDKLADSVRRSRAALAAARELEHSVKRVSAEIIDERLAEISPLLNELYQRLRPHTDWRTIEYSIRGDVRRFLSLKVGDGLNPQFVFSSGQRRAAGLAFLLSVHLARAWTHLRTLILDDPVQHIDDYRSLQLVEVLVALRLDGRQIICAVEDTALADLLCRRLLSTPTEIGCRLDIGLGPHGKVEITQNVEIPPLPVQVLRQGEAS